jgi:glycosyltransferase involved in cell wall biosynthesis
VRISVILLSYNHVRFVPDALNGILSQTRKPHEVILCDDGSIDESSAELKRFHYLYNSTYEIKMILEVVNKGLASMLNNAFSVASGDIWILMAADDVSRPQRIEETVCAYERSGRRARSIWSNARIIDSKGNDSGVYFAKEQSSACKLEKMAAGVSGLLGATQSIHREVWDRFGPIPRDVYTEDTVLPFRAGLLGEVVYIDKPLVDYRHHGQNLSFAGSSKIKPWREFRRPDKLLSRAKNIIAVAEIRISDLESISSVDLPRFQNSRHLVKICYANLRDAKFEYIVATSPRWRIPWLALYGVRIGVSVQRIVRICLLYWLPEIYGFLTSKMFARN